MVMANLWHIHHDPSLWDRPFEFRPDRHLDASGSNVVVSDAFIPYGVGTYTVYNTHYAHYALSL